MLVPSYGLCMTPLTNCRFRYSRGLEHRGRDVDHVGELIA